MSGPGPAARGAHAHEPLDGTVYSAGPRRAGLPADAGNALHYPLTAVCGGCGSVIRCERPDQSGWVRAGRAAAR